MTDDNRVREDADLLYGAPAIAEYLRMRERQARHLIDTKTIPTFKLRGTICARKSTLNKFIADAERAAQGDPQGDAQ